MNQWTEESLFELIRLRFPEPEWVCFAQVGNETGFGKRRTADAVAMNLWPSRGLALHGFEIKCSRNDWRREAKDPSKAEAVARYCSRWWIVAPKGVVPKEELPDAWGLLCPTTDRPEEGAKLRQQKDAVMTPTVQPGREFLAAMLKAHLNARERFQRLDARAIEAKARALMSAHKQHETSLAELKVAAELEQLRKDVTDFQKASGLWIRKYEGERLGEAVKLVLEQGGSLSRISGELLRQAERARDAAQRAIDTLKDTTPKERVSLPRARVRLKG